MKVKKNLFMIVADESYDQVKTSILTVLSELSWAEYGL